MRLETATKKHVSIRISCIHDIETILLPICVFMITRHHPSPTDKTRDVLTGFCLILLMIYSNSKNLLDFSLSLMHSVTLHCVLSFESISQSPLYYISSSKPKPKPVFSGWSVGSSLVLVCYEFLSFFLSFFNK